MIMASNVQVWHFKPKVDVGIIHFALSLGRVLFFSGAGNNDELLAEPTG